MPSIRLGGWRAYLDDDSAKGDPLLGTVRASGTFSGWVDSLGLTGTLQGAGLRAAGASIRGVSASFALGYLVLGAAWDKAGLAVDGIGPSRASRWITSAWTRDSWAAGSRRSG